MNPIKKLRKSAGLSQEEFSKIFNVHQTAVSQWETGRTSPDKEAIIKIASYFNISTDELLGKTDTKKAPTLEEQGEEDKNTIRIAGRDGRYIVKKLSDDQIDLLEKMINALPDADDL